MTSMSERRSQHGRIIYEKQSGNVPSNERPAVSGKKKYTMGMMKAFKEANTGITTKSAKGTTH